MRIRATMKLRNDIVIRAREEVGMNQRDFASFAGVPMYVVCRVETLDFSKKIKEEHILKLATAIGVSPDLIVPPGVDMKLPNEISVVRDLPPERLLSIPDRGKYVLEAPDEQASNQEELKALDETIDKFLSYREGVIVRSAMSGMTLKETGKRIKVCSEHVRHIYAKAMRKLTAPWSPLAKYTTQFAESVEWPENKGGRIRSSHQTVRYDTNERP